MTVTNNAIDLTSQGTCYYNGTGTFSGIDGISPGYVLTSNGTGVAPQFKPASVSQSGAFFAYNGVLNNVLGGGVTNFLIPFNTLAYDTTGGFNTSTGIFTAPVDGIYTFGAVTTFNVPIGSVNVIGVRLAGTGIPAAVSNVLDYDTFPSQNQVPNFMGINGWLKPAANVTVLMTAGQTMSVIAEGDGGAQTTSLQFSAFWGAFLSPPVPIAGGIRWSARLSTSIPNATGDATTVPIVFDDVISNVGGGYNASTGVFTAPMSGLYCTTCLVALGNLGSSFTTGLVNFANHGFDFNPSTMFTPALSETITYTHYIQLIAGQTINVSVGVAGGTKTVTIQGGTGVSGCFFSGFFVGP